MEGSNGDIAVDHYHRYQQPMRITEKNTRMAKRNYVPAFSTHDLGTLKSGLDFVGINHYTSYYAKDCIFSACEPGTGTSKTEGFALRTTQRNGEFIGKPTALDWLYIHPQGMEKMVIYIKHRYNNLPMFITENGLGEMDNPNLTTEDIVNDAKRVEYLSGYLDALMTAMRKAADEREYLVWSLLDNFEWTCGYTIRFGLHHVDYGTLNRTRRMSAIWYKEFIGQHKAGINKKAEHRQQL